MTIDSKISELAVLLGDAFQTYEQIAQSLAEQAQTSSTQAADDASVAQASMIASETAAGNAAASASDAADSAAAAAASALSAAASALAAAASARDFGARGDGVTDDTTAVQAAHDAGRVLVEPDDAVYLVSSLVAKVPVFGGKYKRKSGSTGDFVTTGVTGLHLDCEIDMNNVGGASDKLLAVRHGSFSTGENFVWRNGTENGIDVKSVSDIRLRGRGYNCVTMGIYMLAKTADMTGIDVDVFIDNSALGTANTNGGCKIQAVGGFDVVSPRVHCDVVLAESTAMPANCVGIELFGYNSETPGYAGSDSFVTDAVVSGTVQGGTISLTLHGCPDAVATVQAEGSHSLGLEITAGSPRARLASGSRVTPGAGGVSPGYGVSVTGACHDAVADVDVRGVTNARNSSAASFYVDKSDRVTFSGRAIQSLGAHFVRNRGSDDLDLRGLRCSGSVTRGITLDASVSTCDNLRVSMCSFEGITNFIQAAGTYDGGEFSACMIANSGLLITGSPTLTGYRFDELCRITTTPFGSGAKHVTVHNYVAGGASLLTLTRTGSPEGFITAAVGSICRRDNGGAGTSLYIKESGTGSTGWVAK